MFWWWCIYLGANYEKASDVINLKLEEVGDEALLSMLKGEPLEMWLVDDGVEQSGYVDFICEWKIFDAIVSKTRELGGIMYKGDAASQMDLGLAPLNYL